MTGMMIKWRHTARLYELMCCAGNGPTTDQFAALQIHG
jgi:hypothetical protein